MFEQKNFGFFTNNAIKILACVFMAIDHVGLAFFSQFPIFRIIGRIAFPLFAFLIAEGCKYTKNKTRRLGIIAALGIVFLLFYYIYDGRIYGNIFLTFSVSIAIIYVLDFCKKLVFESNRVINILVGIFLPLITVALAYLLYDKVYFEYGFAGMMLPVVVSLVNFKDIKAPQLFHMLDCHAVKLVLMSLWMLLLCYKPNLGDIQYFCFLSILVLCFYNGKAGTKKFKYLFYIFYPAHLVIIEGISLLLKYI